MSVLLESAREPFFVNKFFRTSEDFFQPRLRRLGGSSLAGMVYVVLKQLRGHRCEGT